MKKLKLIAVVIGVFFLSCEAIGKKHATGAVKAFIPGTYVRAFQGEYAFGNDTLTIEQPGKSTNYYTIQHAMSYRQIINKTPLPLTYRTENWTAAFNEQTNVMEEQTKGKRLSFLPDENMLLLGTNRFTKIK